MAAANVAREAAEAAQAEVEARRQAARALADLERHKAATRLSGGAVRAGELLGVAAWETAVARADARASEEESTARARTAQAEDGVASSRRSLAGARGAAKVVERALDRAAAAERKSALDAEDEASEEHVLARTYAANATNAGRRRP